MMSDKTQVLKSRKDLTYAGSAPGEGVYRCVNCNIKWHLFDSQELPICPFCLNDKFRKE